MKLPELIEALQGIHSEIGSHPKLDGAVDVELEGEEDFVIDRVEPLTTCGCGCWYGANIVIRRINDDV